MHSAHSGIRILMVMQVTNGKTMNERRERKPSLIFKRRHRRVTVSLDENQVIWLDSKVDQRLYHSRSHGIEVAIREIRQQQTKREKVV